MKFRGLWILVVLVAVMTVLFSACHTTPTPGKEANPDADFQYKAGIDQVYIERYIGKDTEVVIPEKIDGLPVTAILSTAFANTNIESVDIPDTVITILDYAFTNCQDLHTVKMGDGVTHIMDEAFRRCTKLENVTLSANLQKIGTSAFEGCESLKKVFIPKSVTDWGMQAFLGCPLTSLTFEDGIKSIGAYACFWGSTFKEITIPSSVERIGEYSFHDNLETVVFLGDAPKEIGKQPFGKVAVIYYNEGTFGWDVSELNQYTLIQGKPN